MIQNKVLVRAGRFQGGKLPYLNYVGQIKPADMAQIIWYGDFGNDSTGTGSISAPFLTFGAALTAFSTLSHKWILKTDLTVYGEADAAPYIDDPADRVYLDPTKADDSGDGLTAANAKKTYAAAKAVLISSGRTAIHGVGSFTLTDTISSRTQGEAGAVLTYNAAADFEVDNQRTLNNYRFYRAAQTATGAIITLGNYGAGAFPEISRSEDGGATWPLTGMGPWGTGGRVYAIAKNASVIIIAGAKPGGGRAVLRSINDGLTWSEVSVDAGGSGNHSYKAAAWTGTNFVIAGDSTAGTARRIYTSPDGLTWTARTIAGADTVTYQDMCSDGLGNVMLVGRTTSTTSYMAFSADNGETWADYSSLVGVGANTGGTICGACFFKNSKWWIVQDTIDAAVYYSATPTVGSWTGISGTLMVQDLIGSPYQYSWSEELGGIIYAPSASVDSDLYLVNESGISVISSTLNTEYNNNGIFIYSYGGSEYALLLGRQGVSPNAGFVKRIPLKAANIRADVSNIVMHSGKLASVSAGCNASNFTAEPTAGQAVYSSDSCEFRQCRIVSADNRPMSHIGAKVKVKRSLLKGTSQALITATAAAAGDVEITQNLFAGGLSLVNTAGTDKETIQDNIIQGNFSASALVTVKGNISGSVVNSTSQSVISTIPPIFVDTTDYFLSRIALGQAVDSPLVNRSAYYSYTYNSATYKDDFGPYRAFTALVETVYRRSFLLPRFSGNALSEDVENVSALLKSIRGKPDVSNRPQGRLDVISWTSKSVNSEVREFVSYMEKLGDLTVYLDYDFNGRAPSSVTINGAHSAGTFEVNISPLDIPVGTVVDLFGKSQIVTQRYPRAGLATKIVLDDVLSGGLSNGQSVAITYIQGAGEFVFVPNKSRKNLRTFSKRRDAYTGMTYTFVRKSE